MFSEIEVTTLEKTTSITTFIRQNGTDIDVIVPIDYYKEPLYVIRKNPNNNGYFIKGELLKTKSLEEAKYYQRRAERKWTIPLRWQQA